MHVHPFEKNPTSVNRSFELQMEGFTIVNLFWWHAPFLKRSKNYVLRHQLSLIDLWTDFCEPFCLWTFFLSKRFTIVNLFVVLFVSQSFCATDQNLWTNLWTDLWTDLLRAPVSRWRCTLERLRQVPAHRVTAVISSSPPKKHVFCLHNLFAKPLKTRCYCILGLPKPNTHIRCTPHLTNQAAASSNPTTTNSTTLHEQHITSVQQQLTFDVAAALKHC